MNTLKNRNKIVEVHNVLRIGARSIAGISILQVSIPTFCLPRRAMATWIQSLLSELSGLELSKAKGD